MNTEVKVPVTTSCYYNNYGNPDSVRISDGLTHKTVRMEYEANNFYAWESYNPLNHVTERTYDAFGRKVSERYDAGSVDYTYSGTTIQAMTGGGQYTSKTTDSQGNLLSAVDPGGITSYTY